MEHPPISELSEGRRAGDDLRIAITPRFELQFCSQRYMTIIIFIKIEFLHHWIQSVNHLCNKGYRFYIVKNKFSDWRNFLQARKEILSHSAEI
jgi:hypothetical protein